MKIYIITEYDIDNSGDGSYHAVLSAFFNEEDAVSAKEDLELSKPDCIKYKITEVDLHGSVEPRLKVETIQIKENGV